MTIEYKDSKRISLLEADRTLVQGNSGGYGTPSSVSSRGAGGGGGGASSAGVSADGTTSGSNGGAGYNNSISGTSTGYAGGGAGAVDNTTGSGTASHGANNSGAYPSNNADANTGAGGSGGGNDTGTNYTGGAGGSGIVIISYEGSQAASGGTITTNTSVTPNKTVHTFLLAQTGTSFTPTSSFNVEYLVIGGGGSGGNRQHGGGGGAGAYRTSTSHAVTAQAYTIVVGAGGASPSGSTNTNGNNGSDSSFDNITSIGGGYGAAFANLGGSGGSGGGGGAGSASTLASGTSSDATPTNVQDNSILVEKDTGRRYWFDGTDWTGNFDLTGLKAYWKFDEASGDIINQATALGSTDSLGSAANIQISGATYGVTGKIGDALSFDGTNDTGVVGSSLSQFNFMHNTSGLFSVNFWVKRDALAQPPVIFTTTSGSGGNIGVWINFVTNNNIDFAIVNGGSYVVTNAGTVNIADTTTWHMVTFTYDYSLGTLNLKSYLDGTASTTLNKTANAASNSNATRAANMFSDANFGFGANNFDEFSIWNRVLTPAEITTLYNSGRGKIVY